MWRPLPTCASRTPPTAPSSAWRRGSSWRTPSPTDAGASEGEAPRLRRQLGRPRVHHLEAVRLVRVVVELLALVVADAVVLEEPVPRLVPVAEGTLEERISHG